MAISIPSQNPDFIEPTAAPGGRQDDHNRHIGRRDVKSRSAAEWITLGISVLIVAGVVGLTTYFYLSSANGPAVLTVEPRAEETYDAGGRYYLPITVRNGGEATAEDVRVRISVADPSGRQESAEVLVQFLAGGGSSRAVASFGSDPRTGQVEAVAVSYLEP